MFIYILISRTLNTLFGVFFLSLFTESNYTVYIYIYIYIYIVGGVLLTNPRLKSRNLK